MNRVIHKYALPWDRQVTVKMATGKILTAQNQKDRIVLWVLTSPLSDVVERDFRIVATGEEYEDDLDAWEYLGTVQVREGVWHVFEIFPF